MSGPIFSCEIPPGTRLTVFEGNVILAGPNMPASVVTPQGLVPIEIDPIERLGVEIRMSALLGNRLTNA